MTPLEKGGDRDYYTGVPLDWSLISVYDNEIFQEKVAENISQVVSEIWPTVDHVTAPDGSSRFVISAPGGSTIAKAIYPSKSFGNCANRFWRTETVESSLHMPDFRAF